MYSEIYVNTFDINNPTPIWNGGCANHKSIKHDSLGTGYTLEKCNNLCGTKSWCKHIFFIHSNGYCWNFAPGCKKDGNSGITYYLSADLSYT